MKKKEITRIVYVTADGREYSSERDAAKHERELAQNLNPQLLAIVLSKNCGRMRNMGDCGNCPFFNNSAECMCILRAWNPWEWDSKIF